MKSLRFILTGGLMCYLMQNSYACMPEDFVLARSPDVIRKRFNSVDTLLTAHLVRSRKIKVKSRADDSELPAEVDTFVVTRVFKGEYRQGQRFTLTTVLLGCGMSAINDPPKVLQLGAVKPRDVRKDWLLYINSKEIPEIQNTEMTMPLQAVSADFPILKKLATK